MPEWLRWALAGLACYRLVQMFGLDDGPWDLLQIMREKLGAYKLGPQLVPMSWWGYLLRCPYCMGLYLGLPIAAACVWPTTAGDLLIGSLAISGAQALLQGRRKGWLSDKMSATQAPHFRYKADGTMEET